MKFANPPKNCDFCGRTLVERDEFYDFAARGGKWGYGCERCYEEYRLHPMLGIGKGQKYVRKGFGKGTEWVKQSKD